MQQILHLFLVGEILCEDQLHLRHCMAEVFVFVAMKIAKSKQIQSTDADDPVSGGLAKLFEHGYHFSVPSMKALLLRFSQDLLLRRQRMIWTQVFLRIIHRKTEPLFTGNGCLLNRAFFAHIGGFLRLLGDHPAFSHKIGRAHV